MSKEKTISVTFKKHLATAIGETYTAELGEHIYDTVLEFIDSYIKSGQAIELEKSEPEQECQGCVGMAKICRERQTKIDWLEAEKKELKQCINDDIDKIEQLQAENTRLMKHLLEHREALQVLSQLRQLYNLSPNMRDPQVESSAKLMMRQAEEGLRLAHQRTQEEYIKQLQAEVRKFAAENEKLKPRPLLFGNLYEFKVIVSEQVPDGQIWFASQSQIDEALEYSRKQIEQILKGSE